MNEVSRRSFLATVTAASLLCPTHNAIGKLAQRNPDAEAIECLLNDDTECAVSVWEREFESNRYNDEARQTYFLSLLVHGLRSLDKGRLTEATKAYETASTLLPSSNAVGFEYLGDATTSFTSLLSLNNMDLHWNSEPRIADTWEGAYLSHTGPAGADTTVYALTAKDPGRFNYFRISTHSNDRVAYRFNFKPMSNSGFITVYLGSFADGGSVFFDLRFYTNWRAFWSAYESMEGSTETLHEGEQIAVDLDQWHSFEARVKPNTVEIWLDYQYLVTLSLPRIEYEYLGFGTGLHPDSYSMTFTALFDDEAMYRLK